MRVSYDSKSDILSIVLCDNRAIAESDEDRPGVILDYDDEGNLVSLEVLDASERVSDARRVEYQMAE